MWDLGSLEIPLCSLLQGEIVFAGLVLGYGANPDIQQNKTDQTALMMAAKSPSEAKSEDMINILMKHHADVNIIDKNNDTALSLALRNGKRSAHFEWKN